MIFNVNPKYLSTIIALIICKLRFVKLLITTIGDLLLQKFFIIIRNLIVRILTKENLYTKTEFDKKLIQKNLIYLVQ